MTLPFRPAIFALTAGIMLTSLAAEAFVRGLDKLAELLDDAASVELATEPDDDVSDGCESCDATETCGVVIANGEPFHVCLDCATILLGNVA